MELKLGVVGEPIAHSMSPVLFGSDITSESDCAALNCSYLRMAATSTDHAFRWAKQMGLHGINVTAPFKDIVRLCTDVDSVAQKVQAANTVVFSGPRSYAFNTDVAGVYHALLPYVRKLETNQQNPQYVTKRPESEVLKIHQPKENPLQAVVLGSGGAARAAVAALHQLGFNIQIAARNAQHAQWTADLPQNVPVIGFDHRRIRAAQVVVDCLSTGQQVVDARAWRCGQVLLSARYQPSAHALQAKECGATVLNGREWLLQQAVAAFHHFSRNHVGADVMRHRLESYKPVKHHGHVALIGLMGAGKSALAPVLGRQLQLPVADVDTLVAQEARMSIPQIFACEGEAGFRQREHLILRRLISGPPCVISTGGGICSNPDNQVWLRKAFTIWLWASPEVLWKRIEKDPNRPLLKIFNSVHKLKLLEQSRRSAYARYCHLVFDTGNTNILCAAERLVKEVHTWLG